MSVMNIIRQRYSVRKYLTKGVEKEKLEQILEAGRLAPTAVNYQPFHLYVVQSKEGLEKVSKTAKVFQAPLIIVVCADKEKAWKRPIDGMITTDIDASIITDHMMLEATELGLGSVWICYFDSVLLKQELNIPEHLEPINILAIGYEDVENSVKRDKTRKPIEELVTYL